jgi:hypothetical protein
MENGAPPQPQPVPEPGFGVSPGWWLVIAGSVLWHALMTLALFDDGSQSYSGLLDERPVVSGRHALHLYHGYLGAREFSRLGRFGVYDPAYGAGYPKTPWFDSGSKPAELFQYLGGSKFSPSAYKLGVAVTWAAVPLLMALAAWCSGLNHAATAFATLASLVVCWSDCGRDRLIQGDLDVVLSAMACVLAFGFGLAYQRRANAVTWFGLTFALCAAVFFQVLLPILLLPTALVYYFGAGWQQPSRWHFGIALSVGIAVLLNGLWLSEALTTWWIRTETVPAVSASGPLAFFEFINHHRLGTEPMLLATVLAIIAAAGGGMIGWYRQGNHVAPRIFALAFVSFLTLGVLGPFWQVHLGFASERLLFAGLLFGAILAGQGIVSLFDVMGKVTGTQLRGAVVTCGLLAAVIIGCHVPLARFWQHTFRTEPLSVGLPSAAQEAMELLQKQTGESARILWEESDATDAWSPLLAQLTGRSYLGGLGSDAAIEHLAARLRDGRLAGRPIEEWTDLELADFARRFNLGWAVCRSDAAKQRFGRWSVVSNTISLSDGSKLYFLRRPHSFALVGKARLVESEPNQITLADVQPMDGIVVLSFHHHPQVLPSADRVRIEREPHVYDGIALIRLRMNAPLARLSLRWND